MKRWQDKGSCPAAFGWLGCTNRAGIFTNFEKGGQFMLIPFMRHCGRFLRCERAVSALEYAVLAGVVIAGVGAAIFTFSETIATSIGTLGTKISTGVGTANKVDLNGT